MAKLLRRPQQAIYRALGYYPTSLGGLPFRCDPDHIEFWRKARTGRWEPRTLEIIDRWLDAASVYLDIGAWIGPTVLYAARKCRSVLCLEPDPVAFEYLLRNLRLNQLENVTPFCLALGDRGGLRALTGLGNGLGGSESTLLPSDHPAPRAWVPAIAWADWLRLAQPDSIELVKIDIEGGEFELLPVMREFLAHRLPPLLLSLHAPLLPPDQRREALGRLSQVMSIYPRCRDLELRPVTAESVVEQSLHSLTSFLYSR